MAAVATSGLCIEHADVMNSREMQRHHKDANAARPCLVILATGLEFC